MRTCVTILWMRVSKYLRIYLKIWKKVIRELPFPKRKNPNQVWSKVLCVRENLKLLLKTFRAKILKNTTPQEFLLVCNLQKGIQNPVRLLSWAFCKNSGFQLLIIVAKSFNLDVWQSSEKASAICSCLELLNFLNIFTWLATQKNDITVDFSSFSA